jgi:hypothetical protein
MNGALFDFPQLLAAGHLISDSSMIVPSYLASGTERLAVASPATRELPGSVQLGAAADIEAGVTKVKKAVSHETFGSRHPFVFTNGE